MNKLNKLIKNEIESNDHITFKRFMELSLYHEEHGYYSSGKVRIGKDGDFIQVLTFIKVLEK